MYYLCVDIVPKQHAHVWESGLSVAILPEELHCFLLPRDPREKAKEKGQLTKVRSLKATGTSFRDVKGDLEVLVQGIEESIGESLNVLFSSDRGD